MFNGHSWEKFQAQTDGQLTDLKFQVTPGVLQLVSHSKVLAEMVNLHFLSLMEALMECHSTILVKLMPLWTPVLFAYQVPPIFTESVPQKCLSWLVA